MESILSFLIIFCQSFHLNHLVFVDEAEGFSYKHSYVKTFINPFLTILFLDLVSISLSQRDCFISDLLEQHAFSVFYC